MNDRLQEVLATVEANCAAVQRSTAGVDRVVDRLRTNVNLISDRATRTRGDVDEWEEAYRNVAETERELEDAVHSYTAPRYVDAVVRGEVSDPVVMVKALSHLVAAQEYLRSKPTNPVGARLLGKVESSLRRGVAATDAKLSSAVVRALRSNVLPPSAATSPPVPGTAVVVPGGRGAARGGHRLFRDDWRRHLGHSHHLVEQHTLVFQRVGPGREVATVIGDRLENYFRSLVGVDYRRAHEGFEGDGSSNGAPHGGTALALAHLARNASSADGRDSLATTTVSRYQQGDHPLPRFSADLRQLTMEACAVLDTVVLTAFPTDPDDPRYHRQMQLPRGDELRGEMLLLPSEVVLRVVDLVFASAFRTIAHAARSPDVGLEDAIFIALDLLSELWQWRKVARQTPGDHDGLVDEVDRNVDRLLDTARRLLDDVRYAKGILSVRELVSIAIDAVPGSVERKMDEAELRQRLPKTVSPTLLQLIGVHSREVVDAAESATIGSGLLSSHHTLPNRLPRVVRCRWIPGLDAAVHNTTSAHMRFVKFLLQTYLPTLSLTLAGDCADGDRLLHKSSSRQGSTSWARVAEEYVEECLNGHLTDLEALADATDFLYNARGGGGTSADPNEQESSSSSSSDENGDAEDRRRRRRSTTVLRQHYHWDTNLATRLQRPRKKGWVATTNFFSAPLFIANNAFFVSRSLREDAPFTGSIRSRQLVAEVLLGYEDRLATAVELYAGLWRAVLPAMPPPALPPGASSNPLAAAARTAANVPLTKSQRKAVKKWYARASKRVQQMLHVSHTHLVAHAALRAGLSDAAATAIGEGFEAFSATVVKGRAWSTHVERHLPVPIPELLAQVRLVFGSTGGGGAGGSSTTTAAAGEHRLFSEEFRSAREADQREALQRQRKVAATTTTLLAAPHGVDPGGAAVQFHTALRASADSPRAASSDEETEDDEGHAAAEEHASHDGNEPEEEELRDSPPPPPPGAPPAGSISFARQSGGASAVPTATFARQSGSGHEGFFRRGGPAIEEL